MEIDVPRLKGEILEGLQNRHADFFLFLACSLNDESVSQNNSFFGMSRWDISALVTDMLRQCKDVDKLLDFKKVLEGAKGVAEEEKRKKLLREYMNKDRPGDKAKNSSESGDEGEKGLEYGAE